MSPRRGRLLLALHAHLPWLRPVDRDDDAAERRLFDALTETYLPLIDQLLALEEDGVPARLAMSFSPTLLAMLTDPLVKARYVRHLDRLVLFAESEVRRLRHEPAWQRAALDCRERLRAVRRSFLDRHEGHLLPALRHLAQRGVLELLASAATHAYLPLHVAQPMVVEAQVRIGLEEFHRHFGWQPAGFWLPECGFAAELDDVLRRAGVRWTLVEGHALTLAQPTPWLGIRAPISTTAGVAVFGRDRALSRVAWSTDDGYPGDADYRDGGSDVAFELPAEVLRPILPSSGERVASGLCYLRRGAAGDEREPYDPQRARAKAGAHARNFVARCGEWVAEAPLRDRPTSLVAAFDAELLGRGWHEGLHWLDQVLRQTAYDQDVVELAHPTDVLEAQPALQEAMPASSSWGDGGYHAPWLGGENDWLYRPLRGAAERMQRLASRHPDARGPCLRALSQACRELLLAQSSDWALLMSRGTCGDLPVLRARRHLSDFASIADQIERDRLDLDALAEIEARDNVFPAIDHRLFAPNESGAGRTSRPAP